VEYVSKIETFYTDKVTGLIGKMKRLKNEVKIERGNLARKRDERSELEDVLIDALEKTRVSIFKRRIEQEKIIKNKELSLKVRQISQ
jgi:hypothetical protein